MGSGPNEVFQPKTTETAVLDLLVLALGIALFATGIAYAILCERL
jgi:hypothetical protein